MTTQEEWICPRCREAAGLVFKGQGGCFLATAYQEGKFRKHTQGDAAAEVNSVFDDMDRVAYQQRVARALGSESLQVDPYGRRNIFYAVN